MNANFSWSKASSAARKASEISDSGNTALKTGKTESGAPDT
jgi:hypothetical protein